MKYQVEESIHNFQFWSGAEDTIAELTMDEMNSLEELIEEMLYYGDELPTDTEINDFVWFERDTIAQHLGYVDFDELMHRNDEPNLPEELFIDSCDICKYWEELDDEEKSDMISDYLTEGYEYCHDGFVYEEGKFFNDNQYFDVYVSNIKWDTTE